MLFFQATERKISQFIKDNEKELRIDLPAVPELNIPKFCLLIESALNGYQITKFDNEHTVTETDTLWSWEVTDNYSIVEFVTKHVKRHYLLSLQPFLS